MGKENNVNIHLFPCRINYVLLPIDRFKTSRVICLLGYMEAPAGVEPALKRLRLLRSRVASPAPYRSDTVPQNAFRF